MSEQVLRVRFSDPIWCLRSRCGGLPPALPGFGRQRRAGERKEEREQKFHTVELFHKSRKLSYIPRMAVDPELLEILACPNCKTPVILVKNGTALKCGSCKRVYAIKDDIPVMLIDEATIED
jgi:uncharacterized protein YbaR (Trm112 family)